MAMTLEPLKPFGVIAHGLDLAQGVDDATFARILAAFNEHALIVFPTQGLDDDNQTEFSARFGRLEGSLREMRMFEDRPVRQEVLDVSNVDARGQLIPRTSKEAIPFVANELWHSDFSFKPVPAMASLLHGRILAPEGGQTEFATQPQFVYRHTWQTGDLVAWDNRSTMHRVRPWDVMRYKRVMRRTTVAGAGPTVAEVRPTRFA